MNPRPIPLLPERDVLAAAADEHEQAVGHLPGLSETHPVTFHLAELGDALSQLAARHCTG